MLTAPADRTAGKAGNPDRALMVLHHALTGRAGIAKAFGLERAGFARNSKALLGWTRSQINIIPGTEDSNDILVLTCGRNSNGKEFPPVAIRRNDAGIYEVAQDFNIEAWREQIVTGKKKEKFDVEMVGDVKFDSELEIKPLAQLIADKTGCGRSRSYELVHEARKAKILRFNKITETYARI